MSDFKPDVGSKGFVVMSINQAELIQTATRQVSGASTEVSRRGCCRLCGATLATTFVDRGMSPLCESFLRGDQIDQMEAYFPLHGAGW